MGSLCALWILRNGFIITELQFIVTYLYNHCLFFCLLDLSSSYSEFQLG